MTEQALLDVIAPPPGYVFNRGIWLTHDLSIAAVNRLVLPVLAGMGTTDYSAAVAAPGLLKQDSLIFVAAGDVVTADALLAGRCARILPLGGTRQHAKAAVLQYERFDPSLATATGLTLTLVTSANLTSSGLTSNREVLAAEWLPSNGGGETISLAVIAAMRALARSMPNGPERAELTRRLTALTRDIRPHHNARVTANEAAIVHSLDGSRKYDGVDSVPTALARLAPRKERPRRLLLVGPAFASNNANVSADLDPLLGTGTKVELVVDTTLTRQDLQAGDKVSVPKGLLDGLRARVGADNVRVYAAAVDDEGGRGRRLHGKSIIAEYADRSLEALGSANLTRRGLSGGNRELVVIAETTSPCIGEVLKTVHAKELRDPQIVGVRKGEELPATVVAAKVPVLATFVPDPGQDARATVLWGVLEVPGHKSSFVTIGDANAKRLRKGQARVELAVTDPRATITSYGVTRTLLVSIEPVEGEAFWTDVPVDTRPEPVDWLLRSLLRDYAKASDAAASGRPGKAAKAANVGANDGFSLPPAHRLNVMARHRRALGMRQPKDVDDILGQLFPDTSEHDVAVSIAQAATRRGRAPRDPLLGSLVEALRSVASPGGEG